MEDSWDMCPYCQKTGFMPGAADLKKTRIDSSASTPTAASIPAVQPAAAPAPARKTVVMADLHKAPLMGWVVVLDGNDKGKDYPGPRWTEFAGFRSFVQHRDYRIPRFPASTPVCASKRASFF